jgi:hypothetical protein
MIFYIDGQGRGVRGDAKRRGEWERTWIELTWEVIKNWKWL